MDVWNQTGKDARTIRTEKNKRKRTKGGTKSLEQIAKEILDVNGKLTLLNLWFVKKSAQIEIAILGSD